MKSGPEQLDATLQGGLAPIYVIGGDEPLLAEEAADAVRARARQAGFAERQVLFVEPGFDWSAFAGELASRSLFGDRRLVELRIPGGKPGEPGARALQAYAAAPAPDVLLLVLCGALDGTARNSKWYQALGQAGVAVQVWPVGAAELPAWIRGRAARAGLRIEPDALSLLVDRTEGHLLAAHQALAQLALLAGDDPVDEALVLATVGHQARFDVQSLAEAAIAGDVVRTRRVLFGLREEGLETPLILWAMARELRLLASHRPGSSWPGNMPPRRRKALEQGLRRAPPQHWRELLVRGVRLDALAKGMLSGGLWAELIDWTQAIARPYQPGSKPLSAGIKS
ncbi:MAG TPA: DNA polymerase III subunit delta [Candidatus Macondimonas sp.]|nr:DNA polymerase III subunit delta [Candidatus Macondimonas sp.]